MDYHSYLFYGMMWPEAYDQYDLMPNSIIESNDKISVREWFKRVEEKARKNGMRLLSGGSPADPTRALAVIDTLRIDRKGTGDFLGSHGKFGIASMDAEYYSRLLVLGAQELQLPCGKIGWWLLSSFD